MKLCNDLPFDGRDVAIATQFVYVTFVKTCVLYQIMKGAELKFVSCFRDFL